MRFGVLLTLVLCAAGANANRGVVVDPTYAYYKGRSAESIVEEIKANGYDEIHLACADGSAIDGELVSAFADAGVKVWMLATVNSARSTDNLPEGWEQWRMKLRRPETSGDFIYLCPNNPAYREWKRQNLVTALAKHPFHGVDLSGSFFPGRLGPESEDYGCLCGSCAAGFKRMYPDVAGPPDFDDPQSGCYWTTDKMLYEKWVGFRVSSIVNFLDDLVNGEDGVREKCPRVKVATWSLGIDSPEPLGKLREWKALDAAAIVKRVRPDVHVVQTDRSDWTKPSLPGSYPVKYKPVAEPIREASPLTPLVLQTDIGSEDNARKTRAWMQDVEKSANDAGFTRVVYHEYSLGEYIYSEAPAVAAAIWMEGVIKLVFNKRVDSVSASNIGNYVLTSGHLDYAKVDGNVVRLSVSGASLPVEVVVSGVSDDEASRLFHDKPACVMERGVTVTVAETATEPDD